MNTKNVNIQEKLTPEQLSKIFQYGSLNAVLEGKNYAMQMICEKVITTSDAFHIFSLLQKYAEGFKNITDLEVENKIRNLLAEKYAFELAMKNAKNIQKFESSERFLKDDQYNKYKQNKKKKATEEEPKKVKKDK